MKIKERCHLTDGLAVSLMSKIWVGKISYGALGMLACNWLTSLNPREGNKNPKTKDKCQNWWKNGRLSHFLLCLTLVLKKTRWWWLFSHHQQFKKHSIPKHNSMRCKSEVNYKNFLTAHRRWPINQESLLKDLAVVQEPLMETVIGCQWSPILQCSERRKRC